MSDKRYAIRDRRYALLAACLIPACVLSLVMASMSAMAAPPPPTPTFDLRPSALDTSSTVCFYRDHALACVNRVGMQRATQAGDEARVLIQALVDGPTSAERATGIRSALPDGTQLADVSVVSDVITIKLVLPEAFLYGGLDPLVSDEITEQIVKTLYPLDQLRKFTVLAQDPRDPSGAFRPLSYFLFEPTPARAESALPSSVLNAPGIARVSAGQPTGALAGKTVYLSAGHGWYWNGNTHDWQTQRYAADSWKIIEDMNNAEVVNQYLVQYLRNAGADVWPVREHDMNTQEMIVVHDQAGYSATGAWDYSTGPGYQGLIYHYAGTVASAATATATWIFTPTTSGRYAVYAWFVTPGTIPRAPDAQYFVVYDGGTTEIQVNQNIHGNKWRYIGTFPFAAGVPGRVILTNHSDTPGTYVIADSVRVGGGMGTDYGSGNGPSGKPRWEEAARYWAKYQGAPSSIYAPSPCTYYGTALTDLCQDITARPNYAEWEHATASAESAVYLSWHSNAYNGGVRGTESYIYYDGDATAGSAQLQSLVHDALISDIRAGWQSDWADRGKKQANFGEVRRLSTMPGALFEIAFHDQQQDADALKDPRFAQLTARAMYKGIARYFGNSSAPILPEPPQSLVVRNSGLGQVTISWRPSPTDTAGLLGDAATGYRVYTSTDGLGWSDGVPVAATVYTLTGLASGRLVFVRVTATNSGGESFPTPIGAARVASGITPVLIVNGYERIDWLMDVMHCDTPEENCPNARIWPAQMNDQSYVIQHATAIPLALDSAVRGAVSTVITLGNYAIVDWIAGQEQTPKPPEGTEVALTEVERDALAAFLASGHGLFLSGSEVAFDLDKTSNLSFLNDTLRAQYVGDDANTFAVSPSASGILSGITPFNFDDGSHGSYAVEWPDVITPTNGATATLSYVGGTGGTAAVEYASGCQRLVYFGFPFETIYPVEVRQAVMARVMGFLSACPINPSPTAVILSPESGGSYKSLTSINGVTGGSTPVDHVDVAVVQITTPLQFLTGTYWVPTQTWLLATGSATWAFTPSVSLTDGQYAVWARAWTTAGISSTNAVVSFTLDTIAPTAPVPITPTGGITLTALDVTLVYSPGLDTNGVAGYNVLVDGNLYTTTATSFPLGSLSAGPHTWTVRAFDAAGNASNWPEAATFATRQFQVYLPLVMRDYSTLPPAPQCQELVANGGFETQDAWYSLSSVKPSYVISPVHSGLSLLIGYTTTANAPASPIYSSMQQTVTIPLNAAKTTLTFWRYPVSGDTIKDFQYLAIGPTPTDLPTLWKWRSNEKGWTLTTVDLSAYTGTLTIRFGVYNDGTGGVTAMYLDDVSVQSCSP